MLLLWIQLLDILVQQKHGKEYWNTVLETIVQRGEGNCEGIQVFLVVFLYYYYDAMHVILKQVKQCVTCQCMNKKIVTEIPELHPVPVKSPWHHIGMGFIVPISPVSASGNCYIFTIISLSLARLGITAPNKEPRNQNENVSTISTSDTDFIPPLPPPFVYKGPYNDQSESLMGNFNIDFCGYT